MARVTLIVCMSRILEIKVGENVDNSTITKLHSGTFRATTLEKKSKNN